MLLVENGDVYTPAPRGRASILIAGGRIEAIGTIDGAALARAGVEVETIDASGCLVVPGLVDPHIHLIGGSGEQGFASASPPISHEELLRAGITTVVGTLGTDTTTKTMPALLARVKALREEGLSAYAWTGGYDARALTGSIRDDIILFDEVIGAGELAIADRRGVPLTAAELARLATDCYVAGTFTRKAGVLHLHTGDAPSRLAVLREVLDTYPVEPATLYPTHVERNEALMSEAIELTRRGVSIDVDVVERDLAHWLRFYRDHGGDPDRLTISSDAPIAPAAGLLEQLAGCLRAEILPREQVLALATRNPARLLKLDSGELAPGKRGHLLLLDERTFELKRTICGQ